MNNSTLIPFSKYDKDKLREISKKGNEASLKVRRAKREAINQAKIEAKAREEMIHEECIDLKRQSAELLRLAIKSGIIK